MSNPSHFPTLYLGTAIVNNNHFDFSSNSIVTAPRPTGNFEVANRIYVDELVKYQADRIDSILFDASINLDTLKEVSDYAKTLTEDAAFALNNKINDVSSNLISEIQHRIDGDAALLTTLTSFVTSVDASLNLVDTRLSVVDASFNSVHSSLNIIDISLNLVDIRLSGVDASFNAVDASLNALELADNELHNIITTLSTRVDLSLNEIDTRLSVLDASFNSVHSSLNIIDISLNLLDTRLSGVDASFNSVYSSLNIVDISLNYIDEILGFHDASLNSFNTKFNAVDASFYVVDSSLNYFNTKFNALDSSFIAVDASLNALELADATLRGIVDTFSTRVDASLNDISTHITTETTLRTSGDSDLLNRIDILFKYFFHSTSEGATIDSQFRIMYPDLTSQPIVPEPSNIQNTINPDIEV
jgi:hypothetical protein